MNTNKPIVSIALALVCAAICVGCYSTGHEVKTDSLKKLEAGVTTEQQAIELLGKPTSRTESSDGSVTLMFMHYTIVPIPFHPEGSSESVTVFFDENGKFKKYTSSQTKQ